MRTHHGIRGARDPGLDGAPRLQVGPAAPEPMAMGGSEMDHSILRFVRGDGRDSPNLRLHTTGKSMGCVAGFLWRYVWIARSMDRGPLAEAVVIQKTVLPRISFFRTVQKMEAARLSPMTKYSLGPSFIASISQGIF